MNGYPFDRSRTLEPGPAPSLLADRVPAQILATKDSLQAQMQRSTAKWRWLNRKGNTP